MFSFLLFFLNRKHVTRFCFYFPGASSLVYHLDSFLYLPFASRRLNSTYYSLYEISGSSSSQSRSREFKLNFSCLSPLVKGGNIRKKKSWKIILHVGATRGASRGTRTRPLNRVTAFSSGWLGPAVPSSRGGACIFGWLKYNVCRIEKNGRER